MSNIARCTDSQASFLAPSPPPRRNERLTTEAQKNVELLNKDFYDISEEAAGGAVTFDRWRGERPAGIEGKCNMSAGDLKRSILDFLEPPTSGPAGEGSVLSATSATGVSVDTQTSQVTLPNGKSITLKGALGNTRITELQDGGFVVVNETSTTTYDKDGNEVSTEEGAYNPLTGTDGNDFILNFTGTDVDGGAGDDTILNYAARAALRGGSGNDKIIQGGTSVEDINVDLGEGDDSFEAATLFRNMEGTLAVNGGAGNDSIKLGRIMSDNVTVNGGSGDDTISVQRISASSDKNPVIDGGSGNDTIFVDGVFGGTITGGGGNDTIIADTIWGGSVQGSGGKNVINVGTAINSTIGIGSDGNTINVGSMYRSLLYAGGENNTVNVDMMVGSMLFDKDAFAALAKSPEAKKSETGQEEEDPGALAENKPHMLEDASQRFTNLLAQSTEIRRSSPMLL